MFKKILQQTLIVMENRYGIKKEGTDIVSLIGQIDAARNIDAVKTELIDWMSSRPNQDVCTQYFIAHIEEKLSLDY